jgi:hypothetical protein
MHSLIVRIWGSCTAGSSQDGVATALARTHPPMISPASLTDTSMHQFDSEHRARLADDRPFHREEATWIGPGADLTKCVQSEYDDPTFGLLVTAVVDDLQPARTSEELALASRTSP